MSTVLDSKLAVMWVPVLSWSSSWHTLPSVEQAYRTSGSDDTSAQL